MRQIHAHFPKVRFYSWELRSILLRIQNLPQMIVRVAETHTDTRLANIIHVEFRINWRDDGHSCRLAYQRWKDRNIQDQNNLAHIVHYFQHLSMTCADDAIFSSELSVSRILVERINPSIADSDASNLDFSRCVEIVCNLRDIMPSKRFASQVHGEVLELVVFWVKIMQKMVEVQCNLRFLVAVVFNRICRAEASSDWLVNEQNVSYIVPRVVVVLKGRSLFHGRTGVVFPIVRSIFCVKTQHTWTPWTTVKQNY